MKAKNTVYLSLGSNLDRANKLKSCLKYLSASFKKTRISPVYQSPSYGFDGNDFYNLVVEIETCFELCSLKHWLMKVEDNHGRDRSKPRYSNRTLDIDILLFNDLILDNQYFKLPRAEILTQAYVLRPLVDIAADKIHPQSQRPLIEHWQNIKNQQAPIKKVRLS